MRFPSTGGGTVFCGSGTESREPNHEVDETRPWQLVRAALPRCREDAIPLHELVARCGVPWPTVEAGLVALAREAPGTRRVRTPEGWRVYYQWPTRAPPGATPATRHPSPVPLPLEDTHP